MKLKNKLLALALACSMLTSMAVTGVGATETVADDLVAAPVAASVVESPVAAQEVEFVEVLDAIDVTEPVAASAAMTTFAATTFATQSNVATVTGSDGVVKNSYTSLSSAVSAAVSGDTVTLLYNTTLTSCLSISKSITLNLGGNTLTSSSTSNAAILVNTSGIDVMIKNGTVQTNTVAKTVWNNNGNSLTLEALTLINTYSGGNAFTGANSSNIVTIRDCNFTGTSYAIYVTTGTVTIESGGYTGGSWGIYQVGGTLNLTGGTIDGDSYAVVLGSNSTITFGGENVTGPVLDVGVATITDSTGQTITVYSGFFKVLDGNINNNIVEGYKISTSTNEDGYYTIVAETDVATVTDSDGDIKGTYTNLATAIANAGAGDTVTLIDNVSISSTLTLSNSIILDLGGYTLTSSTTAIDVGTADVVATIKNGTITAYGHGVSSEGVASLTLEDLSITSTNNYGLRISSNTNPTYDNNVIVGEGCTITGNVYAVVMLGKKSLVLEDDTYVTPTLTINGGYIYCNNGVAIGGSGSYDGTEITINGGIITASQQAIYHPQYGTLTINGGTITGACGVQFCCDGTFTMTGGSIIGTADYMEWPIKDASQSDGTVEAGAALMFISRGVDTTGYQNFGTGMWATISGGTLESYNNEPIIVCLMDYVTDAYYFNEYIVSGRVENALEQLNITGGTFIGARDFSIEEKAYGDDVVQISGGTFAVEPDSAYLDDTYKSVAYNDLYYVVEDTVFVIEFDAGSGTASFDEAMTGADGKLTSLPSASLSGYTFLGWFYDSDDDGVDEQVTTSTVFDSEPETIITVYADWAKKSTSSSSSSSSSSSDNTDTSDDSDDAEEVIVEDEEEVLDEEVLDEEILDEEILDDEVVEEEIAETVGDFEDVTVDTYYADAVQWAVDNAVTTGTSGSSFSPEEDCSRAEIVTFLYRAFGEPDADSDAESLFEDIDSESYYSDAVAWAADNGVTTGLEDGSFGADLICTRAQIVTFLYRAAGEPDITSDISFADVDSDSYYAAAVAWAYENGITLGTGDDSFSPDENCTRGQIVTFLYRYMGE